MMHPKDEIDWDNLMPGEDGPKKYRFTPDATPCAECGDDLSELYIQCFQCGKPMHNKCAVWRMQDGEQTPYCDDCGTPLVYIDRYGPELGPAIMEQQAITAWAARTANTMQASAARAVRKAVGG